MLQRFRQPRLNLVDAGRIGRMRRKKLRNRLLSAETQFSDHLPGTPAHAFPKGNGFPRVVPRFRHQTQADIVRLRLLFPVERQRHIHAIGAQRAGNRPAAAMRPDRGADRAAPDEDDASGLPWVGYDPVPASETACGAAGRQT